MRTATLCLLLVAPLCLAPRTAAANRDVSHAASDATSHAAESEVGLWMTAAINMRQLPAIDRVTRWPGEAAEVAAVAELICEVHDSQPRCGSQCTSTRRDRSHLPDYSDYVVERVTCWDLARIFVAAAHDYGVPLDELLATAYQESRFREFALGSGAECGLFQQATHHIRWSSENVPGMARLPFDDGREVCAYLLRPENAIWHFALKYHHEVAQNGSAWAAYYNGGVNMWGYHRRHESYRERFVAFLVAFEEREGVEFVLLGTEHDG